MSETKLIIYFFRNKGEKSYYSSIRLLNKDYDIKNKYISIDIEDKNFNKEKEKIVLDLEIIPYDILSNILKYRINIFFGINKAYCFLNKTSDLLIEYNYIGEEKIFYKTYELKENDGNGLVKRLTLINSPLTLLISGKKINFSNTIEKMKKEYNSFEITDFNYSNFLFGIKAIEKYEKFSIIENMKKQKAELEKFYYNIKEMIDKKLDKIKYNILFKNFEIKEYPLNFSQKKDILKNEFKTNEDYYIMFLYWIWYSIKACFYKEKYKCGISIIDLFNNIYDIYQLYYKDNELLIYQKILLLYSNVSFLLEKNDIQKYKSANLRYIKRKDIKDNSIYKLSFDFLSDFISKLTERSYLFYPLLMLDSENYYYNIDFEYKEHIYGYNRESINVIKEHLNQLLPEVFFEYSDEGNIIRKENGFNYKGFKVIFLNRLAILKNLEKDAANDENISVEEKRVFKHYAILSAKTIMHESFGHNKRIYNNKNKITSPSRFYNKEKRFVKMIPFSSREKSDNNIELFKSLNERLTGESGKFFEYFFGKYNDNVLIIDLIFQIEYIGNLLDNIDYFVKENLDELKQYIINKYKISIYKDIKYDDKGLTLEEENRMMTKLISKYEEEHKINIKNKDQEIKEDDELIAQQFQSKKDIIFLEEDFDNEYNKSMNINEEDKGWFPFFIALHKSSK